MPRYYFHVRDDRFPRDREGVDLPDIEAAWREATTTCGEVLRDMDGSIEVGVEWRMDVSDEAGRALFRFHFTAERCASNPV